MFNLKVRHLSTAIVGYQSAMNRFVIARDEALRRQTKLVNPSLTDQEIDHLLESEDQSPVEMKTVHLLAASKEIQDECSALRAEQARMQKLRRSVVEIQELFDICFVLMMQNQEILDEIEGTIDEAIVMVTAANDDVEQTEMYIKRKRKWKFRAAIAVIVGFLGVGIGVFVL